MSHLFLILRKNSTISAEAAASFLHRVIQSDLSQSEPVLQTYLKIDTKSTRSDFSLINNYMIINLKGFYCF